MERRTATKIMTRREKARIAYFPHAYNYIMKEEILKGFHSVNREKVESIKELLKNNLHIAEKASEVAEKIIKGV
ncbi:MAG: hypothetical protein JXD21_02410 [Candidatus Omnitrophica bacterium]|nr:hypothetical protein [Candidatus Omnitrophota bacterium]